MKMIAPRRLFQTIGISVRLLLLLQLSSSSSFVAAFSCNTAAQRSQSQSSSRQSKHHHPVLSRTRSPLPLRATPRPSTTTIPSTPVTTTVNRSSDCSRSRSRTSNTIAKPRTGFAQSLLNLALSSPIWTYILVPQARATIVKTAEENGIPWKLAKKWLVKQMEVEGQWGNDSQESHSRLGDVQYPEYYRKSFHAYPEGNLSYDAAVEQELASRAVGARNFPKYSSRGEDVFRGAFDAALIKLGAGIPQDPKKEVENIIIDFGCGTGTSTRRLANQYPQATQLIGIDLSPYFIEVGQTLLKLSPSAIVVEDRESIMNTNNAEVNGWITDINSDDRIQLRQGDMANTHLPSNSVAVVNLSLVIHELPISATKQVIQEAYRILRPGGQLWISEMDFESPAYAAQRENALLFSLLRATEPYLDEYADGMPELRKYIAELFDVVKISAATGRHFALLAEKGNDGGHAVLEDYRFREDGSYAIEDTHLKPWESKQNDLAEGEASA